MIEVVARADHEAFPRLAGNGDVEIAYGLPGAGQILDAVEGETRTSLDPIPRVASKNVARRPGRSTATEPRTPQ